MVPNHHRRGCCRWLALVLLLAVPAPAPAQESDTEAPRLPKWEIGPYVGGSWHAPKVIGIIPNRRHLFLGVQLTANVIRTERWAFGYSPEIVPLLLVSNNPTYRTIEVPGLGDRRVVNGRAPVAGFAVTPIALQAQVRIGSRWRAYAGTAGGAVWFTREMPVPGSRAFNYTFEFGGGVRWQMSPGTALRAGYKFHHLSNGYSAQENPGLDAMVLLIGVERVLGR